jgi:hypothetical protein
MVFEFLRKMLARIGYKKEADKILREFSPLNKGYSADSEC